MNKTDLEQEAQACLEGAPRTVAVVKNLNSRLKGAGLFGLARRILDHIEIAPPDDADDAFAIWRQQQRALCTYKDTERPPLTALREALSILGGIGLYDPATDNAETLGLGGAIFKRFWEQEGNAANLHSALALYRAGWERGRDSYRPYCGINAACLLDRLAHMAKRAAIGVGGDTSESDRLYAEARTLRTDVLTSLSPAQKDATDDGRFWREATRAEALFGLGDYAAAQAVIAALAKRPDDWKYDTFVRQLIDIAHSQGIQPTLDASGGEKARQAAQALQPLLGDDLDAALGLVRGRVGLALSGGGFRAAFYHLGVLARLAEVDALRHAEVISTVSGGSIVGAMYYLKLKRLLESRHDKAALARDDYVELVATLQTEFFAGVSRNLRARTLANLWLNLKMMLPCYSRSLRIGELYEEVLFARVDGKCRRSMPDLLIRPAGAADATSFKPNAENWRRRHKVPVLLLNATTLNSGHNFQFTANWLGEPPGLMGDEIDLNTRYRRIYYRDTPTDELKNFPLGHAVAASSGVPILFAPITLRELYPKHTVELVDGGVHDNQGVAGLLDEGCNFIICSDASGQMEDQAKPGTGMIDVALRSSGIGQDRIRETQYADLAARERGGALRGLCFVHLKDGLARKTVDAAGQPPGASGPSNTPPKTQTDYGIDCDIQSALADIRTDLDSFSEVEAYSLMLSGYLAMRHQLEVENRRHRRKGEPGTWGGFDIFSKPARPWRFLELQAIASRPCNKEDAQRSDLEAQLCVGKQMFLKTLRLDTRARWVAIAFGLLLAAAGGYLLWQAWGCTLFSIQLGPAAIVMLALLLPATRFLWPARLRRDLLLRFAVPILAWMPTWFHLCLLEPVFQRRGRIARLLKLPTHRN